jgi:TIR domain
LAGRSIRLTQYLPEDVDILEGEVFEDDEIIGPAVIGILNDVTFENNASAGNPDEILWEVPQRTRMIGPIGVRNCIFRRCRFRGIGIVSTPELIAKFRGDIGLHQLRPLKLFYSYSHRDEEHRDRLQAHLATLRRQGSIEDWHDRKILPGEIWAEKIDTKLQTADIILLLVSADFINSDYCYGRELEVALERHAVNEARVVPIIVQPVDWTGTPISDLQALPPDARPVTTWPNQEEAWVKVATGIREVVDDLQRRRM